MHVGFGSEALGSGLGSSSTVKTWVNLILHKNLEFA